MVIISQNHNVEILSHYFEIPSHHNDLQIGVTVATGDHRAYFHVSSAKVYMCENDSEASLQDNRVTGHNTEMTNKLDKHKYKIKRVNPCTYDIGNIGNKRSEIRFVVRSTQYCININTQE